MSINYEDAAQEQIASADLGKVSKIANDQAELQATKQQLEEQLKVVNDQLNSIKHTDLPEAMLEVGLSEIVLSTGAKVVVRPFYSLSIKNKDNKEPAFTWLEEHDAGDIIKVTVSVMFAPSEIQEAAELAQNLTYDGFDVIVDKNVHPMTLKSWLKNNEHLADEIPAELFNVYVGQVATIKGAS